MTTVKKSSNNPLISVIIPAYNASQSLPVTLDSIICQTYKEIEIIIVNDGSSDDTQAVAQEYASKDTRIRIETHEKNKGLFQARLTGSDAATGDYICFLDADDTISIDYYRTLLNTSVAESADLTLSEVVINDVSQGKKYTYSLANEMGFQTLDHTEAFQAFMTQHGANQNWHVAWNKLIDIKLWKKARQEYSAISKHLVMTEDIAISAPLWFYATKVAQARTAYYFYTKGGDDASTSMSSLTYAKATKDIGDMKQSFTFFDNLLKKHSMTDKYETLLYTWKQFLAKIWQDNVSQSQLSSTEKAKLSQEIDTIATFDKDDRELNFHLYDIHIEWNNGLEKIKELIASDETKIVSFDIFDTLVVRPFETPSDLFHLMNNYFRELHPSLTLLNFHDIRIEAESLARQQHSHLEEITLDDIYTTLREVYAVDEKTSALLKKRELKLEVHFTQPRKTAKELFTLSKYLKKTTIITTDMYLPKDAIENILKESGYKAWDALFVSSELKLTKHTSSVYSHIKEQLSANASHILHIGDNFHADVEMAKKSGIKSLHLPSTFSAFYSQGGVNKLYEHIGDTVNGYSGRSYLGIKSMLAMTANRFYDNPFSPIIFGSIFNASPEQMGYFGLGMHLYGVLNWLENDMKSEKFDNLVFLARDGYLPLKAYSIIHEDTKANLHYLPSSRKANVSLSIANPSDVYHINKFINVHRHTIKDVLSILQNIVDEKDAEKLLQDRKYAKNTVIKDLSYKEFVTDVQKVINWDKVAKLRTAFTAKYANEFSGKVAVFDVGYSAKPEQILSKVFDKPIHTYFIHSDSEGAQKAIDSTDVQLKTFFNYFPSLGSELRELSLSEIGPSTIRYTLNKDDLTVEYAKDYTIAYYERFIVESMQNNALDFIRDIQDLFGDMREHLVYSHEYISLPYESIMGRRSGLDKSIFVPFAFEDDMGGGTLAVKPYFEDHGNQTLEANLIGKRKIIKALVYALVDRGEFIGRTKRKIKLKTESRPKLQKTLHSGWKLAKKVKQNIKKS